MDWKPIDSAPKDGRRILVHDYQRPVFARWKDCFLASTASGTVFDWVDDYGSALQCVTHWMAPPANPTLDTCARAQQQQISSETDVNETGA